jgi:hypothetical protein
MPAILDQDKPNPVKPELKIISIVKSRILSFFWIRACAGMTICELISITYKIGHTRAGGYPGAKMTFGEFVKIED